jgi:hypothetical protein
MSLLPDVTADAQVSDCGTYRYVLTRRWRPQARTVLWIMLNPSSAAASVDDRTIRKCQKYARAWGYGGIVVANLFALRATSPVDLIRHPDPIGPDNDRTLRHLVAADPGVDLVVAAWGAQGALHDRSQAVQQLAADAGRDLHALDLTKDDEPRHPLYLRDSLTPTLWRPAPATTTPRSTMSSEINIRFRTEQDRDQVDVTRIGIAADVSGDGLTVTVEPDIDGWDGIKPETGAEILRSALAAAGIWVDIFDESSAPLAESSSGGVQ